MDVAGKVALVTGAGRGIGRAIALALIANGASGVGVLDVDGEHAMRVATEMPVGKGLNLGVDVTDERGLREAVAEVERRLGPVDLCVSNAGLIGGGGVEAADETWQRLWGVHVMAHVYLARALLPGMRARGSGHFVLTASAAGVLTALGDAPYSVTKAATVALAEWLAITHRDEGIGVSCLCPQGVDTAMFNDARDSLTGQAVLSGGPLLAPEKVAAAVVAAVADERFFVFPHPEVAEYVQRKVADPDGWLVGMARMQARLQREG
jgi:NAD(P)-dependent dehydrogenase (short-subunit alcohol dehydrogenase family)